MAQAQGACLEALSEVLGPWLRDEQGPVSEALALQMIDKTETAA